MKSIFFIIALFLSVRTSYAQSNLEASPFSNNLIAAMLNNPSLAANTSKHRIGFGFKRSNLYNVPNYLSIATFETKIDQYLGIGFGIEHQQIADYASTAIHSSLSYQKVQISNSKLLFGLGISLYNNRFNTSQDNIFPDQIRLYTENLSPSNNNIGYLSLSAWHIQFSGGAMLVNNRFLFGVSFRAFDTVLAGATSYLMPWQIKNQLGIKLFSSHNNKIKGYTNLFTNYSLLGFRCSIQFMASLPLKNGELSAGIAYKSNKSWNFSAGLRIKEINIMVSFELIRSSSQQLYSSQEFHLQNEWGQKSNSLTNSMADYARYIK